jgi:hypothetical protein
MTWTRETAKGATYALQTKADLRSTFIMLRTVLGLWLDAIFQWGLPCPPSTDLAVQESGFERHGATRALAAATGFADSTDQKMEQATRVRWWPLIWFETHEFGFTVCFTLTTKDGQAVTHLDHPPEHHLLISSDLTHRVNRPINGGVDVPWSIPLPHWLPAVMRDSSAVLY